MAVDGKPAGASTGRSQSHLSDAGTDQEVMTELYSAPGAISMVFLRSPAEIRTGHVHLSSVAKQEGTGEL